MWFVDSWFHSSPWFMEPSVPSIVHLQFFNDCFEFARALLDLVHGNFVPMFPFRQFYDVMQCKPLVRKRFVKIVMLKQLNRVRPVSRFSRATIRRLDLVFRFIGSVTHDSSPISLCSSTSGSKQLLEETYCSVFLKSYFLCKGLNGLQLHVLPLPLRGLQALSGFARFYHPGPLEIDYCSIFSTYKSCPSAILELSYTTGHEAQYSKPCFLIGSTHDIDNSWHYPCPTQMWRIIIDCKWFIIEC